MFVWSDELALLLRDEGDATSRQLSHWIASPVGYRLAEGVDPIAFARRLWREEVDSTPTLLSISPPRSRHLRVDGGEMRVLPPNLR